MDAYDCERIDKAMNKRVEAVYSDPARHRFYSQFQADEDLDTTGPRGGKVRGSKRRCCHCGQPAPGHAATTEPL